MDSEKVGRVLSRMKPKTEAEERLERQGGKIAGNLRFTLMWSCLDDLDMHIICPSGEEIYYGHKCSACGGELDIDMNAGGNRSNNPVENVIWTGDVPTGEFKVKIHNCSGNEIPFSMEISDGDKLTHLEGFWYVNPRTSFATPRPPDGIVHRQAKSRGRKHIPYACAPGRACTRALDANTNS